MTTVPDPGERFARVLEATPTMEDVPWTPLMKPLRQCRVALVTTGDVHIRDRQALAATTAKEVARLLKADKVEATFLTPA